MDIPIADIKHLVELMVTHDLSRIELREGDAHILLRRGQPVVAAPIPALPLAAAPAPSQVHATQVSPNTSGGSSGVIASAESTETYIRSPMVGTFYSASDPESPAFVSVGDFVKPDSVVCLVEAMKVFNEIKAELSGRVTKVLVKNAEAVEFDQPLFALAPA